MLLYPHKQPKHKLCMHHKWAHNLYYIAISKSKQWLKDM